MSLIAVSCLVACTWAVTDQIIPIKVSPNVLNIGSSGTVVTVHTEIAYSLVVGSSVTLNGLEISHWKSDNQGNFVAKFDMDEVKGLVESGDLPLGTQTLILAGTTVTGETFSGSTQIEIVNNVPKK